MAKTQRTQGLSTAFVDIFPTPIKATSAPASTDVNYDIGQIWCDTSAGAFYVLSKLASGAATWVTTTSVTGDLTVTGDIILSSVATQLQMNGGAVTDFIGQATLTSGTVTIANTNIAATDRIFLTRADANSSTALGLLTITAQTASTSFVITALDPADGSTTITGDVSVVNYFIVRQN